MNKIEIAFTGHLLTGPELRFGRSGKAVADLWVACNRRVRGNDGEWTDAPVTKMNVTVFGVLAENAAGSLEKGSPVTIRGGLITETWADKETGEERSAQKVIADDVSFPLARHTVRAEKVERKSANNDSDSPN